MTAELRITDIGWPLPLEVWDAKCMPTGPEGGMPKRAHVGSSPVLPMRPFVGVDRGLGSEGG